VGRDAKKRLKDQDEHTEATAGGNVVRLATMSRTEKLQHIQTPGPGGGM
jgi:hypothetical protein